MVIVGSSVVAGKLMVESFPVFFANGIVLAVGSAVLIPLLVRREGRFLAVGKQNLLILFLLALTGIVLFRVLLLYGLNFTTAAEGGIITSTTPAVVGLISFLFLKESLGPNVVVGIVLAVLGIMAINVPLTGLEAERGPNPLLGNVLVFGAVIGEALFTIFGKALSERVTPLATATATSVLALLMFLPFSVGEALHFDFSAPSPADWLPILYYGVAVTALAFLLWFSGLSRVPASKAGVFIGVLPVSAVVLSYVVLGEPFVWSHLVGVSCVLLAILLIAREEPVAPDQESTTLR
jgi:drug/metabolite transporter (DMT)-like permease